MSGRGDRDYARQAQRMREHTRSMEAAGFVNGRQDGPGAAELRALLARFRVEDRRDLTGQVLGDPLPGRSALDERRRVAEAAAQAAQRSLYRTPRNGSGACPLGTCGEGGGSGLQALTRSTSEAA